MVQETEYLLEYDFSRVTKRFRILDNYIPLEEIVIIQLKIN